MFYEETKESYFIVFDGWKTGQIDIKKIFFCKHECDDPFCIYAKIGTLALCAYALLALRSRGRESTEPACICASKKARQTRGEEEEEEEEFRYKVPRTLLLGRDALSMRGTEAGPAASNGALFSSRSRGMLICDPDPPYLNPNRTLVRLLLYHALFVSQLSSSFLRNFSVFLPQKPPEHTTISTRRSLVCAFSWPVVDHSLLIGKPVLRIVSGSTGLNCANSCLRILFQSVQ